MRALQAEEAVHDQPQNIVQKKDNECGGNTREGGYKCDDSSSTLEVLVVHHLLCRLVPRNLRPSSQLNLLLVLNNGTTAAPKGCTAIPTAAALDAESIAHLTSPDRLDDPVATYHAQKGIERTLSSKVSGIFIRCRRVHTSKLK